MVFEDYMKYSCNLSVLSEYAKQKGIVESYFGQLKGKYREFFKNSSNIQQVKYAIRMYRTQKEMLCSAQMLAEAQQSKENGCVIGFFFLCYYALFHAMQANLFMNINISDDEILQLSHSKVESYFEDFYCKGKKSIMSHEIIDFFQILKGFREMYSYDMPFNNPENINVDIEKLTYFIRLCFQLCSLNSLVISQIRVAVGVHGEEWQEVKKYFSECCYKKNLVTGEIINDIADKAFLKEMITYGGVDIMPFSVIADHHFDEYGGYDSNILDKMGFNNVDKVRSAAFKFYYNTIV